ncbi:Ankyrin-2 [Sticta canariensis]|nr:Ankyrin-2 [Sticta canariensis]
METLHRAALRGDKETVKTLIGAGADVNAVGGTYGTALQAAAADDGNPEIVETLIKAGADVNAVGGTYGTALQAAACGKPEIVETLIKAGADVNAVGGTYGTALQAAACRGKPEIVETLIKAGADVKAVDGEFGTALQAAALGGDPEIVETLIKAGADVNAVGGTYGTALQAATCRGKPEIVETLIKAGADVNAVGGTYGTALQAAAWGGDPEILKALIKAGADVNAVGGRYGTAIQAAAAAAYCGIRTVEILMNAGANVNVTGGIYGSALQAAIATSKSSNDVMRLVLGNPALVNFESRASDGSCLLHAAVDSPGDLRILTHLLNAGAGELMNVQNVSGQTPFHLAAISGKLQILETLYPFSQGPDSIFEVQDIDGQTALHLAVEKRAVEVVKWLLKKGASADSRDFSDSTPFLRAFQMKNFEMARLLFPKTTKDAKLPNASQWRAVQSRNSDQVLMMTNGELATVEMMSKKKLSQYIDDRSYSLNPRFSSLGTKEKSMAEDTPERRIFLLTDGIPFTPGVQWRWWHLTRLKKKSYEQSQLMKLDPLERESNQVWEPLDKVPSAVILDQIRSGECFLECRVALPVFLTDWGELPETLKKSSFKYLKNLHAVVWIMVKPKVSKTEPKARGPLLESKTFFSTLEFAAVPDTPTDLFVPLVQQLWGEWNDVYNDADQHLSLRRKNLLNSNGEDTKLISFLLQDAKLWEVLSRLLKDQVKTLRSLGESYENKNGTILHEENEKMVEEKINDFKKETNHLSEEVQKLLKNLTETSQNLIQLEFNLTSIAEAQKSTSMNRSMKRLSWITFIFLPLTFIGTLFGMNVDILDSEPKPHWEWYLPWAFVTIFLTLVVWIAFKFGNLEKWVEEKFRSLLNRIKGKFRWLLREKTRDEEEGLERTLNREGVRKLKNL